MGTKGGLVFRLPSILNHLINYYISKLLSIFPIQNLLNQEVLFFNFKHHYYLLFFLFWWQLVKILTNILLTEMRPHYLVQNIYDCVQFLQLDILFKHGYTAAINHLQKELWENLLVNRLQGLNLVMRYLNLYKISHSDKS